MAKFPGFIRKINLFSLNQGKILDLTLLGFSIVIGLLAAVGALVFRFLIELFQTLFWAEGATLVEQAANTPWWLILGIPTTGGLIAGPLITYLVPEARGPGVPEVIQAVTTRQSTIRHRVTLLKAAITGLLIGAGASVGREGPIVQIGSSVGSSLAQFFGLNPELRRLCLACGAAAGIAATFNAPIAGSMFAMEIILMNIEVSYISFIVISAITGSVFSRLFWGELPAFQVTPFVLDSHWELSAYLVLGLAAGLVSIAFVWLIFKIEDLFNLIPIPEWIKPGLGGLGLGGLALMLPQVLGVGYETVNLALSASLGLTLAIFLLAGKMLATSLCIGSGMSGGIFAPSLFLGGCLGTIVGFGATLFWPELPISPAFFALAGMGAVVSGTTLAPITAIVTIFELTLHYQIILPLMLACISATLVVRFLSGYSVYELKLIRKGVNIFRGHDIAILRNIFVKDVMRKDFEAVYSDTSLKPIVDMIQQTPFPHFVVLDKQKKLAGVLSLRDLRSALIHFEDLKDLVVAAELMTREVVTLLETDDLEKGLHLFEKHHMSMIPIIRPDNRVSGILSRDDLLKAYDQKVLKDRILSRNG
ncbi:MAG: chloride channel protein [Desulfohalobiaceae bacterium]|nr:chloride channel protein [Desulfohalobiaceae bacterium]